MPDQHRYVPLDGNSMHNDESFLLPPTARRGGGNPSGELPAVPRSFLPASYTPQRHRSPITVTGHDKFHPGHLPAYIFRFATLLLVLLWFIGCFLTLGTESTGLQGFTQVVAPRHNLPKMRKGETILVEWPTHLGFVPRALSCDPSGEIIVVADDLALFSGRVVRADKDVQIDDARIRSVQHIPVLATEAQRVQKERVSTSRPVAVNPLISHRPLTLHFTRVEAQCALLDGHELNDVSVICTDKPFWCRVLVLYDRGRRLAECPLSNEGTICNKKMQVPLSRG